MKPNKPRLRLWVKGLRSGKWRQGHGSLAPEPGFRCCLGVACEVYNEAPACIGHEKKVRGFGRASFLPKQVQHWLGVGYDPILHGGRATTLNDIDDKSFDHIAAAIERQFDLR